MCIFYTLGIYECKCYADPPNMIRRERKKNKIKKCIVDTNLKQNRPKIQVTKIYF